MCRLNLETWFLVFAWFGILFACASFGVVVRCFCLVVCFDLLSSCRIRSSDMYYCLFPSFFCFSLCFPWMIRLLSCLRCITSDVLVCSGDIPDVWRWWVSFDYLHEKCYKCVPYFCLCDNHLTWSFILITQILPGRSC